MENKLDIVLKLLDNIEVKGKQNLNNVLACIQLITEYQEEHKE